MPSQVHPTAVVDSSAEIGADIVIGPHVVVEADVRIGDRCRLQAGAAVLRWTTLGADNVVHPNAVLGGPPQDHKHDPSIRSFLQIGRGNVFREGCTINRATGADEATVIGDENYFMTCAHVGHNCKVGSNCVMTNSSALGGYAELGDRAILSANVMIHQFCRVGAGVMSQGNSAAGMHVPPYCMLVAISELRGLNRVGLRRTPGITEQDIRQVREAYDLLYRRNLNMEQALAELDARDDWGGPATRFRTFVHEALEAEPPYRRGICRDVTRRKR